MKKVNSIQLEGDNNIVIQGVDQNGKIIVNTINWDDFKQKYTIELKQRIDELKKLLERSEDLFAKKTLELSGDINRLQQQLEEREIQIKNILKQFEQKDISSTSVLYQNAFNYFINGELDKSLNELEESKLDEKEIQQADARILKAYILRLQFDFKNAEINLKRAVDIFPSWNNYFILTKFYQDINMLIKAESLYTICLEKVDSDENKATTLSNLAVLQRTINKFEQSEKSFLEALEIRRKLAVINPQNNLHKLASTLANLAILKKAQNEFDLAGEFYFEALEIYRKLAQSNSQINLASVGITLNNLANLMCDINKFDLAEKYFNEALEIRRNLAESNPQIYLPYVATTLNNWATLMNDKNDFEKAEEFYSESINIFRNFAKLNPQTYLPYIAITLNNCAKLQIDKNDFKQAEKFFNEALEIYIKLANVNPQIYLPFTGMIQLNLSILYQSSIINKELSISLINNTFDDLIQFCKLPYIQNYLVRALQVLKDWEINIDKYLDDKNFSQPETKSLLKEISKV